MISKILGLVIDFILGMIVCAYLLSHTAIGFKIYTTIADVPTITAEQVQEGMNNLFAKGKALYQAGGKIYNALK